MGSGFLIHVLLIQSMFHQSSPAHVLSHALFCLCNPTWLARDSKLEPQSQFFGTGTGYGKIKKARQFFTPKKNRKGMHIRIKASRVKSNFEVIPGRRESFTWRSGHLSQGSHIILFQPLNRLLIPDISCKRHKNWKIAKSFRAMFPYHRWFQTEKFLLINIPWRKMYMSGLLILCNGAVLYGWS